MQELTNKQNHRPQDDVPYEVIVKYIIRDYRRNLQAIEMLEPYTRHLEEVVRKQHEELQALRKYKSETKLLPEDLQKAQQRIRELTDQVNQLKRNEYDGTSALRKITKSALQKRISQLEQWITSYGLSIPEPTQSQILREKNM